MITLFSEALTTYLSLYLHRIFKFYFFLFLTFIFSVLVIQISKHLNLLKTFADVSISEKIQNFDNFIVPAAQNLTVS